MRKSACLALLVPSMFASAALADSMQSVPMSFGPWRASNGSYYTPVSFAGFDPVAGQLQSISLNLSGSGSGSGLGTELFQLSAGPDSGQFVSNFVTKTVVAGQPVAIALVSYYFVFYENAGVINAYVDILGIPLLPISDLTGTVTYDYTPAAVPPVATPEPSSLTLLGTGMLAVYGTVRRRFSS